MKIYRHFTLRRHDMKTALITGSSRGIGRAVARELAHQGWSVGINYLTREDKARELVEELRADGCLAAAFQADVADGAAVAEMVRKLGETFSPVELVVNNAGVAGQSLFQDITDEMWNRYLAVNLGGARNTIKAVLPHMISEKRGCIVNISSIWGQRGASCEVAYACTKAGIIALTRSLAMELAPSGIRVNCVAPGVINTDMVQVLGQETLDELVKETPLGRLGTPEDIAYAREYLGLNDGEGFNWGLIRGGMSSVARLFVAQMQDYLELGLHHRTNVPGTQSGNWQWRLLPGEATPALARRIRHMTELYGR